ncbi:MAG: hypothetical protein KDK23_15095, partial [Leptospiraceae bacterium]|nr:hypothetical protein [Leptospiraceae bacterium]
YSPLHYYTSKDPNLTNPKGETAFGFPIIPLIYANRKNSEGDSTNYLTVFHSFHSGDESTYISPFYYWESNKDYSVRWTPLYMEDTREDGYFHLPPFWFSDRDPEGDSNFSLLHYYSEDKDGDVLGFPIIPILYASRTSGDYSRHNLLTVFYWDSSSNESTTFLPPYYHSQTLTRSNVARGTDLNQDEQAGALDVVLPDPQPESRTIGTDRSKDNLSSEDHYNVALLMDWKKKNGEMQRFNFLPLYYQGFGEEPYIYFIPLYFQDESADSFTSWGPLHYYSTDEKENSLFLPLLPVIYAARDDGETRKRNYLTIFYTRDGPDGYLRFLPPYYHAHDIKTESSGIVREDHYNIALLTNWNSRNDELQDFILAPFFFWDKGPEGYTHIVPFYFEDRSPERKLNFGPIHYFRQDDTTEYLWFLPYYSWINKGEDPSSGNVFVPFYFNYEDPVKNYHVNLGGLSLSEESVDVRVNTVSGETKAVSVLDTNIGWLYNFFSYSARIPLQETEDTRVRRPETVQDIPEGEQILSVETFDPDLAGEDKQPDLVPVEEGVSIKKDTSISRENSIRFSGWSVLFGLFARESADQRHHARALPFFWLSWDDASEDQVTVIPGAYMSYDEAPNHYYVLFPLFIPVYGTQETPDYSLTAYGLFLYLDEEDRIAKQTETSIVWPFYNHFDSPEASGRRLLPLYYSKRYKHDDGRSYDEFSLTPISYSTETRVFAPGAGPGAEPVEVQSAFYSPLYLGSESRYREHVSEWSFWPIPMYYSSTEGTEKTQNLLLLVNRNSNTNGETESFRIFPIFFYGQDYHSVFPLYYYSETTESQSAFISPIYWNEKNGGTAEHRLLWIFNWTASETQKDSFNAFPIFFYEEDSHLALFPLYFGFGEPDSRIHWGPIYYFEDTGYSRDMLIGPVYSSASDSRGLEEAGDNPQRGSFHIFPLIFSWYDETGSQALYGPYYTESGKDYSRKYIPLLFESEWWGRENGDEVGQTDFLLGSIYYEDRSTHSGWGALYRLLAGYESGDPSGTSPNPSTSDRWNFNFLSFVLATDGQNVHRSFLPLYWYESEGNSTEFHFAPLFLNFWDGEEYQGLYTILYLQSGPGYSRQYIPLLFENESYENNDQNRHSFSMLLNTVDYERSPGITSFALLYRVLLGYESRRALNRSGQPTEDSSWNFNLLSFVVADGNESYHNSFLPLYWYDEDSYETTFHFIPLLSFNFSRKEEYIGFQGPLYIEKNPNLSRYYIPLLFESVDEPASGGSYSSTDFLLSSFKFTNGPDYSEYSFLYRVLGGYSSYDANSWNMNLLTFVVADEPSGFHQSFLPLYWYSRDNEERFLALPPLLGWSSRTPNTTSECYGACLLWYNSRDDYRKEHYKAVLMGGLLYYDRYRNQPNGYREWGSVYGFLWSYIDEERKDFEKFSILKFVYSQVRSEGTTTYRVLGIKLNNWD